MTCPACPKTPETCWLSPSLCQHPERSRPALTRVHVVAETDLGGPALGRLVEDMHRALVAVDGVLRVESYAPEHLQTDQQAQAIPPAPEPRRAS